MRNRGAIIILTVIVTALCVYYLSMTFLARNIKNDATAFATDEAGNVNFTQKQAYLDSLRNVPVIDLGFAELTYEDIEATELNLGLDLQGGMHVTLEVNPADVIKGLSGNSEDPAFLKSLELAAQRQRESQSTFTTLFYSAWQEEGNGRSLSDIFATSANSQRVSFNSTDGEVMDLIEEEVDAAIDRSFNIIRSRIDRFGASQPNIQRIPNTGRIQVELPGVEDNSRVRRLLQDVAKLEFFLLYEDNSIVNSINAINDLLLKEAEAAKALGTDQEGETSTEGGLTQAQQEEANDADALFGSSLDNPENAELAQTEDSTSADSLEAALALAGADSALQQQSQASPLLALNRPGGQGVLTYEVKDTATISAIFARPEVKRLLPPNVKLLWAVKPVGATTTGEEVLDLFAIRTERGGKAQLDGDVVVTASKEINPTGGGYQIDMQMNAEGAKNWKRLTGRNVGKPVAVVLDSYVYTAPTVQGEIPNGRSVITGQFSDEEADDLANILKAGSLPAPTRIVEEAIVGPTLGREAQRQGIASMLAGLAIVILFMIAYYSRGGIIANIALLFNIFFIVGILAQLGAALTLPGIAGIVLTIGMSIDANVLIFERIREELRNGAGVMAAIKAGYGKAFSSIVDANVTTLLTGVILYALGQGPVKGFAITLIIGICCSFFSAVYITRVIVTFLTKRGDQSKISFATPFSKGLLSKTNIDFLGRRRIAYLVSASIIAVGVVVLSTSGLNLGVDFKGGRSYVVAFSQPVTATDLKTDLITAFDNEGTEVKTYGANNIVKVTTSYRVNDESEEADNDVKERLINGISGAKGMQFVTNAEEMPENTFAIVGNNKVGATIADDIRNSSYRAVIFSLLAIFFYILVRFNRWQYGLGAVVALFHDVLMVLSAYAIAGLLGFSFEADQVFIAAMLTVVGYSINDTVVVFDRIRETMTTRVKHTRFENFNLSVNQTINRTLITSVTTLIVVLVLLIFGGEVLRGFSFALLIGILVGTYSSVFIATPTVLDLSKDKKSGGSGSAPAKGRVATA